MLPYLGPLAGVGFIGNGPDKRATSQSTGEKSESAINGGKV